MADDVNSFVKGLRNSQRRRRLLTADTGPLDEALPNNFLGITATEDPDGTQRRGAHPIIAIEPPAIEEEVEGELEPQLKPGNATFVSAQVSKLRGSDDNTEVFLVLDGKIVVEMSFNKARILGLEKRHNPFGVVFHKGKQKVKTLTIGFPAALYFETKLELWVRVREAHVAKIEATVVWGTEASQEGGGDPPGGPEDFP